MPEKPTFTQEELSDIWGRSVSTFCVGCGAPAEPFDESGNSKCCGAPVLELEFMSAIEQERVFDAAAKHLLYGDEEPPVEEENEINEEEENGSMVSIEEEVVVEAPVAEKKPKAERVTGPVEATPEEKAIIDSDLKKAEKARQLYAISKSRSRVAKLLGTTYQAVFAATREKPPKKAQTAEEAIE